MKDYNEMNAVEKIREWCRILDVPVSRLEKDLKYGNGYLNPEKASDLKMSRFFEMLDYLGITIDEYFTGTKKDPATESDGNEEPSLKEKHKFVTSLFDQLSFENQIRAVNELQSLLHGQQDTDDHQ